MKFQARPIDQVRSFYEKLVAQFPNAGRYWKAYIDHEVIHLLKTLLFQVLISYFTSPSVFCGEVVFGFRLWSFQQKIHFHAYAEEILSSI